MKPSARKRLTGCALSLFALFLGLIVIFPLLYGVLGAFRSNAEFAAKPPALLPASFAYTQNFVDVWLKVPIPRYFLNSLIISLLTASVRMLCAVLAAYAVAFYEFRGKDLLFFIVLATMMLPADTLVITNYRTVARLGLLDTYLGMSVVSFAGAGAMFMLRQRFIMFPREIRDAGRIDGCGDMRFLWDVLMPICRPVVSALFAQSFINAWNAYLWPLLVTNRDVMRPIQVGITMLSTYEDTNYYLMLAGVTVAMIPAVILFLLLRRSITRAMTDSSLVG